LVAQLDRRHADQEAAGLGSPALTQALVEKLLAASLAIADAEPTEPEPTRVPAQEAPSERHPLWDDLAGGGHQASSVRLIDFDKEAGVYTHQTRRHGGAWSEPEPIRPAAIESERRATAALAGVRLRVVCTALSLSRSRGPRGGAGSSPGTRRSSCRPRAPSDDSGSERGPGDPPPLGAQRSGLRHVALRDAGYCGGRRDDEPFSDERVASIVRPREVAPS
jgi:hypothetical protein